MPKPQLEVVAGGAGNVTAPPLSDAAATISGAGGADDERIEAVAFRRPDIGGKAAAGRRPVRWGRLAAWAAAAALVAGATLVFTSTPVEVVIEPDAARVAFEGGWPALRFGDTHLVRPGRYSLVASSDGYETLSVPVEVTVILRVAGQATVVEVRPEAPLVDRTLTGTRAQVSFVGIPNHGSSIARCPGLDLRRNPFHLYAPYENPGRETGR